MTSDIVKVGMVGLGLASTPHLKGYLSHPRAQVVAVCDLNEDRAKRFAKQHGIPQVFTSFDEMLLADVDAVDIVSEEEEPVADGSDEQSLVPLPVAPSTRLPAPAVEFHALRRLLRKGF